MACERISSVDDLKTAGYKTSKQYDVTDIPWPYVGSSGTADLAAWSGKVGPKYGDYVVVGNMVLLCEGTDSATAMDRCNALLANVVGDGAA